MPVLLVVVAMVLSSDPLEEQAARLKAEGVRLLEHISKITLQAPRKDSFEFRAMEKVAGCIQNTLSATKDRSEGGYEYVSVIDTHREQNVRVHHEVRTVFDRSFCPKHILITHQVFDGQGGKRGQRQEAVLDEKNIVLRTIRAGRTSEKTVPRPPGRFVLLCEPLFEAMPLGAGDEFSLFELNPDNGQLIERRCAVVVAQEGALRIEISTPSVDQRGTDYYVLGPDRRVIERGEVNGMAHYTRISEEQHRALVKSLGLD